MRSTLTITPGRTASKRPASLACALLLAASAPAARAQGRETVTLDQAIERALRQDPRIVQALGDEDVAGAARRTAYGNYLPTLSASASTSFVEAAEGTKPLVRSSAGAGLSLGWDLFTGFRRGALESQALAQLHAARAALVQGRSAVALDVEETFFENLRGRDLETVAGARVTRAQEGLDAATRKSAAGAATRSDVLRAELELHTARRSLLEARTQRDIAAFALGRLVGAEGPVDADADLRAAVEAARLDEERFVAELVARSPDVVAAEAALRSARAGVTVARSDWWPQLSLGAGYDWGVATASRWPGDAAWSLQLGLSFPIFDGFRRDENATRARAQESVASAALADTRRAVRATAEQLLGALRLARDQIAIAERSVAVAEEDLRVQQERYRTGVSTMLDLLTSQESLALAQTNLVAARFDTRLAYATLLALQGREP